MIDWHSHVLPALDDGSGSVDESLELLRMLSEQGVDTVIATPHFYADRESVSSFIERREESYKALCDALTEDMPRILLGAEVSYYSGIGRLEELSRLCIEGTDILLLEMPFIKWSESVVREVELMLISTSYTVVLAHIERYYDLKNGDAIERLLSCGALAQSNAGFFCRRGSRRLALKLLRLGTVSLIGSDTHNIAHRPPRIGEACEIIEKKLGSEYTEKINGLGYSLLRMN
ncbi:MAG: capsular polysaccharide biosynthesis protein [Clostridia bacterium]|nr:capsular polysaccharide biosynthesis protein [Clostridia bacterium]